MIACVVISAQAWGQVANSTFTRFGIGENYSNALANTQGMSGIGVSHPQTWFINNQNPALLTYNRFTSFQMGLLAESRRIKKDNISEKMVGGNLNYLAIAFPVLPKSTYVTKWSTSIGLMPYSSLNYKVEFTDEIEGSTNPAKVVEEGSGGITQLYWSNGVRITNEISAGLKASYLFGAIDKIHKLQPQDDEPGGATLVSAAEIKSIVKDFSFSLGGSYSKDSLWGKDYRVSVGATYSFATDLNTKVVSKYAILNTGSDTIASSPSTRYTGQTHLPASLSTGISLSNTKWVVGTEFNYQDWSSFRRPDAFQDNLQEAWKIALGGEYTPDPLAVEGFLTRTTYRLGVSTEKCPYLVNGKTVKDTGVNFGFSLPAGRSSLDIAFKFGKRGNKTDNLISENYFKVFFGITFNDKWFIRRRFD